MLLVVLRFLPHLLYVMTKSVMMMNAKFHRHVLVHDPTEVELKLMTNVSMNLNEKAKNKTNEKLLM